MFTCLNDVCNAKREELIQYLENYVITLGIQHVSIKRYSDESTKFLREVAIKTFTIEGH